MKQEYKELLLKDLCARLPYKVKSSYHGAEEECECWDEVEGIVNDYVEIGQYSLPIEAVKPYLFPFTSMTEKQKAELSMLVVGVGDVFKSFLIEVEFYHKHHIDYRGLIPMGLALDATGLNIY